MAQLSRPFQIAFVAVALFAAVWLVALRGHSSSTSGGGSSPAPAATAPKASGKASSPGSPYHGSAPGVEGLTHAIAKAQGAVATSKQNAKQLEQKSAEASSSTGGTAAAPSTAKSAAPSATKSTPAKAAPAQPTVKKHAGAAPTAAKAAPSPQRAVEAELKHGKIVVLLFWNPQGADDVVTHQAVEQLGGKVAVHVGSAKTVASYGSITRGVQVYSTPTVLIINRHGNVRTLTGSTDAYSLRQAIQEARHG